MCMLSVIFIRNGSILLDHKAKYGVFLGDVPIEIYGYFIGIPTAIIFVGVLIMFITNKVRNKKYENSNKD